MSFAFSAFIELAASDALLFPPANEMLIYDVSPCPSNSRTSNFLPDFATAFFIAAKASPILDTTEYAARLSSFSHALSPTANCDVDSASCSRSSTLTILAGTLTTLDWESLAVVTFAVTSPASTAWTLKSAGIVASCAAVSAVSRLLTFTAKRFEQRLPRCLSARPGIRRPRPRSR